MQKLTKTLPETKLFPLSVKAVARWQASLPAGLLFCRLKLLHFYQIRLKGNRQTRLQMSLKDSLQKSFDKEQFENSIPFVRKKTQKN